MSKALLWKDISRDYTLELCGALSDRKRFEALLEPVLRVAGSETAPVLYELFYNVVKFAALDARLEPEKISSLFSIVRRVHEEAVAKFLTLDASFEQFKALLLAHSVQRPPFSISVFSVEDAKRVTDFVTDSYYRHYKLYQYTFAAHRELVLRSVPPAGLTEPPQFAPLSAARPWTAEDEAAAVAPAVAERSAPVDSAAGGERAAADEGASATGTGDATAAAGAASAATTAAAAAPAPTDPLSGAAVRDYAMQAAAAEIARLREAMEAQLREQQKALLEKLAEVEARLPPPAKGK